MPSPVNVSDFEAIARERMTPSAFDYYAGGAEDEVTLSENREAFRRIALRPRMLVGADRVDTTVDVLGISALLPCRACADGLQQTGASRRRGGGRAGRRQSRDADVLQHGFIDIA